MGHSAGLGVSTEMPGAVKLFFNQAASFSPTYFYGLLLTDTNLIVGDAHDVAGFHGQRLGVHLYQTTASLQDLFATQESDRWRRLQLHRSPERIGPLERYRFHGVRTMHPRRRRNTALTGEPRYRSGEFGYGGDGTTTRGGDEYWRGTTPTVCQPAGACRCEPIAAAPCVRLRAARRTLPGSSGNTGRLRRRSSTSSGWSWQMRNGRATRRRVPGRPAGTRLRHWLGSRRGWSAVPAGGFFGSRGLFEWCVHPDAEHARA